jgi:hypothetical protein
MTPGIDDPLHHPCPSTEMSFILTLLGTFDEISFMEGTHMIVHLIFLNPTLSFCAAFVRHLSRMISDIRLAYHHWSGWNTFVHGWRIPMHHGDDVQPP